MSLNANVDAIARFPFLALLQRELVALLRTRRLFFGLLLLSIAAAWTVLAQWPYGDTFNWSVLVRSSESLFNTFAGCALTAGPLIVAAIASNSLVGERERDTWDLLQLSLITRAGIVTGKLLGPFAMFALTLTVCAPVFAALLFLAGVDYVRAGQCLLLILATALTCSAIALASSVRARKTVSAATIAFFFVALFMGLGPGIVWIVLNSIDEVFGISTFFFDYDSFFIVTPYFALGKILGGGASIWGVLGVHLAFQLAVFGLSTTFCAWGLGRGEIPIVEEISGARWFPQRESSHIPPTRGHRSIPDRSNPIFRRELYWGSPLATRRARRVAIMLFCGALLVSSAVAYAGSFESSADSRLIMMLVATVIAGALGCLYIPVACASAYTKELAISNFDLLRGTLMKPDEIVWGKFKAALALCAFVWGACFLATFPVNFVCFGEENAALLLTTSFGSLFAALVEAAVAGMLVSFYSRRGGAAIAATYLLVFMLYLGFFLVLMVAAETIDGNLNSTGLLFRFFVATSPIVAYFWTAIESVDGGEPQRLYVWLASLVFAGAFAVTSQLWIIGRFHARIGKIGDR